MNWNRAKDLATTYLFVLPAVLSFVVFFLIFPFFKVFQLSVFDWDGIAYRKCVLLGWIISATPFFVIPLGGFPCGMLPKSPFLTLLFQNTLALILALIVDREIKGKSFYRVVFYLPPVLSGIVVGLVWNWIFDGSHGLLNYALTGIGLGGWTRAWLADPKTALLSVAVIHMWKGFGWGFVILFGGSPSHTTRTHRSGSRRWRGRMADLFEDHRPSHAARFLSCFRLDHPRNDANFRHHHLHDKRRAGYHTEVPITRILVAMVGSSMLWLMPVRWAFCSA